MTVRSARFEARVREKWLSPCCCHVSQYGSNAPPSRASARRCRSAGPASTQTRSWAADATPATAAKAPQPSTITAPPAPPDRAPAGPPPLRPPPTPPPPVPPPPVAGHTAQAGPDRPPIDLQNSGIQSVPSRIRVVESQ